jgi:hypothetical protein
MFKRLAKRERILILAALATFVLIIIVPVGNMLARAYGESQAEVAAARDRLHQAEMVRQAILDDRAAQQAFRQILRTQGGPRDLLSYVNTCVVDLELQDRVNLRNMPRQNQPNADIVHVSVRNVNLNQLVDLLHRIHAGNRLVALESLRRLGPSRDGKGLECELELKTPRA